MPLGVFTCIRWRKWSTKRLAVYRRLAVIFVDHHVIKISVSTTIKDLLPRTITIIEQCQGAKLENCILKSAARIPFPDTSPFGKQKPHFGQIVISINQLCQCRNAIPVDVQDIARWPIVCICPPPPIAGRRNYAKAVVHFLAELASSPLNFYELYVL